MDAPSVVHDESNEHAFVPQQRRVFEVFAGVGFGEVGQDGRVEHDRQDRLWKKKIGRPTGPRGVKKTEKTGGAEIRVRKPKERRGRGEGEGRVFYFLGKGVSNECQTIERKRLLLLQNFTL